MSDFDSRQHRSMCIDDAGKSRPLPRDLRTEQWERRLADLPRPAGDWPADGSVAVSLLVPVLNEENNLVECLNHLRWVQERIVVDSVSQDDTVAVAQAMGADVHRFIYSREGWPKKRNWALETVPWGNEWVLILDADEIATPGLAREVAEVVAGRWRPSRPNRAGSGDAFWINRRFMFMGRWIKGCGYYPSWNIRLFKHRCARYERIGTLGDTGSGDNEVHEHMIVKNGKAGYLDEEFLHFAYPDLTVWIEKHNRYSTWEAHAMSAGNRGQIGARLFGSPIERRRWLKKLARRLPMRPTLRFLYSYILQRGFLDGRPGFVMCRLLAWYEFVSIAKLWEMRSASRDARRPDGFGSGS